MNGLQLAEELHDWYWKNQEFIGPVSKAIDMLRHQHFELETLKIRATKTVMAEHCTCYKLGYSPLNDYASVKQK